jgi:hypothetical protein
MTSQIYPCEEVADARSLELVPIGVPRDFPVTLSAKSSGCFSLCELPLPFGVAWSLGVGLYTH